MDRRGIMSGGKQFDVVFSASEGAENCRAEINGRKLFTGNHKAERGKRIICKINVPVRSPGGQIIFNKDIVAYSGYAMETREISYSIKVRGNVEITAENKNGFLAMSITEK